MPSFTWTPEFGAAQNSKPTVTVVKFGDGYEARNSSGLNPLLRTWPLSFNLREVAEIDAIDAFLTARGGSESFEWTPPRASDPVKVVCDEWSRAFDNAQFDSITATFREVAEP